MKSCLLCESVKTHIPLFLYNTKFQSKHLKQYKMIKSIGFLTLGLLFVTTILAQVNYPFPQNISYPYGHNLTTVNSAQLKTDFETWWGQYYEESGQLARIKFDDKSLTVSEGIGYGMLLAVYMSDNNKSYQTEFDKLWTYYNSFLNENGLMHWQISGFSHVVGSNAATDAELDVAVALIMAYYQFGDENYKTDALSLLSKIRQYEVDENMVLKPGDVWNSKKNPSYFSYFGLGLFAQFDSSNKSFWNDVIHASFSEVLENQSDAGISSDWYNPNNPKDNLGTEMSYDGIRTPWRVALGYAWWGGDNAEIYLDCILNSFENTSASDIKDKIQYATGSIIGAYNNATFVGAIGSVFIRSSAYSNKLSEYYTNLENQEWDINNSYFGGAFDILYRLTLSGNFPNLAAISTSTHFNKIVADQEVINVYPNPASSSITIIKPVEGVVHICDVSGRVVKSTSDTYVNVSDLTVGTYFCVMEGGIAARFVKQ